MKPEINSRSKAGKTPNIWRLDNIFLNNQWVKKEIEKLTTMNVQKIDIIAKGIKMPDSKEE